MKNKILIFLIIIVAFVLILVLLNRNNVVNRVNIPTDQVDHSSNPKQVLIQNSNKPRYPQFVETYIKTQTTGTIYSYEYNGKIYYSIQRSLAQGEGLTFYDSQGNVVGIYNSSLGPNGIQGMGGQLINSSSILIWKGNY